METRSESSGRRSPFGRKLFILGTLTAIFGIAVLLTPYPAKLAPQILLGAMFAHSAELLHELNHRKQFLNEHLNRWVAVILGFPMLISASLYKFLHGLHHKFLGTPQDTDSFSYNYEQITTVGSFILHLSMFNHYLSSLKRMRAAVLDVMELRDNMPLHIKVRVRDEFRLMAGCITIMLILTLVLQTELFLDIWLIPLILSAGPAHTLIELPEHLGCCSNTTDPLKNTRTIRAGKFLTWYVNGNNYHVEHHWNAAVPLEKLPELHSQLASKIDRLEPSYWAFYRKFLRDLFYKALGRNLSSPREPIQ